MAERTGVDIILKGRDETAAAFRSAERNIAKLGQGAASGAAKVGGQLAGGILKGFAAVAVGQLFDDALRQGLEAFDAGKSGAEFASTFLDGFSRTLEDTPVVGPLGGWIARGIDALTGGTMESLRKQDASRVAAEALQQQLQAVDEAVGDLQAQALTEQEQRLREFQKRAGELVRNLPLGTRRAQVERLQAAFDESERVRAQKEADAETAKDLEKAERDQARAEAERFTVAQRALAETKRLREANLAAELNLAGAVERGQVSTRALQFRNQRLSAAQAAAGSSQAQVKEQQLTNKVLDAMLREAVETKRAVQALAGTQQVIQIVEL